MKRLRWWCTIFFGWLFLLYNIERIHAPINLASFVYLLAAAAALPIILVPRLHRTAFHWLFLPIIPLTLLLKLRLGQSIGGTHLPLTITELCALGLTIFLARQIGQSLEEFHRAAVSTLVNHLHERCRPFEQGQGEFYREIRRARAFQRPLALLAISPSQESVKLSLDRFTEDVQQAMVQNYVRARIADLLSKNTKDCDIITDHNGHFVTLLPETSRQAAEETVETLRQAAKKVLGLDLQIGMSVFPEEEVTFVNLLKRAEQQMAGGDEFNGNGNGSRNGNGRPHPATLPAARSNGNGHSALSASASRTPAHAQRSHEAPL